MHLENDINQAVLIMTVTHSEFWPVIIFNKKSWRKLKRVMITCSASLSTSMDTLEMARWALWILEFLRIWMYLLSMLAGSSISRTFDLSLTPHNSRYCPFSRSFPLNIIFWSPGCNPVSAISSFFNSPVS